MDAVLREQQERIMLNAIPLMKWCIDVAIEEGECEEALADVYTQAEIFVRNYEELKGGK